MRVRQTGETYIGERTLAPTSLPTCACLCRPCRAAARALRSLWGELVCAVELSCAAVG